MMRWKETRAIIIAAVMPWLFVLVVWIFVEATSRLSGRVLGFGLLSFLSLIFGASTYFETRDRC